MMSRVPFHQKVKYKMFDISSNSTQAFLSAPTWYLPAASYGTDCLWNTSLKMFGENEGERAHRRCGDEGIRVNHKR
ncbi:hypothetical protein I79_004448 [Cricetulus griseus]|uniref:Uncharacterized protein n=1 Tax=Cricetulus griseus TaxID=10029 RepID=G3H2N1_CRIGR|nr:hypothetical protein I79_004448 [Cricetulus griseus]